MKKEKLKNFMHRAKPAVMTVVFIMLVCLLLIYLLRVFTMKDDKHAEQTFRAFYDQKEDSLDGIYLGSSSAYRYWIPTEAYRKYGLAIFNLGTGSQPVVLQKYLIEEALKTQPDMKIIIIDIRSLTTPAEKHKEADIRRVTDGMKSSKTRREAIRAALKFFKAEGAEISYNTAYYDYPFLLYHNRWKEDLTLRELRGKHKGNKYKGFIPTIHSLNAVEMEQPAYTSETAEPTSLRKKTLQDLLDYCKTLDQKVVFVSAPYAMNEDRQALMHAYMKQIRENGFETFDFNTPELVEKLDLDWSRDFMDTKHVNYYGAVKYTRFVAKLVKKRISSTDHRVEPAYVSWDGSVGRLDEKMDRVRLHYVLTELPGEAMKKTRKAVDRLGKGTLLNGKA